MYLEKKSDTLFLCFILYIIYFFIFIGLPFNLNAADINNNSLQTVKYENLSADNPVFELFRDELNDDPVRMGEALKNANDIVGKIKNRLKNANYASEIQLPTRPLDLLYAVLRDELMATYPENGVELVSEGLLATPPLIDCDTSCALFVIVGHELKWPLSIMSCTGLENNDNSHVFLKWTNEDGITWYYETTCGNTMKEYTDIFLYSQMYKTITEISTEQFFANFFLIAGEQKSCDTNFQRRIELYTKAIERGATLLPKSSQFYNRGNAYLAIGKYEEAIHDYTTSLVVGPQSSRMYYNRAIAHLYLENRLKSLQDLIMAIELDPEHKNARYNRSVLYFQEKHYAMALSDALWLSRKYPDDKDYQELCREIKRILNDCLLLESECRNKLESVKK
jgi:tetratricopeptide (TPR) repeat protein